jgi:hypothetical protein
MDERWAQSISAFATRPRGSPDRTSELVVHTLDLARALGLADEPPATPAAEALRVVADVAPRRGAAGAILRAATGRSTLGPGFTVL